MPDDFIQTTKRHLKGLLPQRWRSDLTLVPVVRLSGAIGMSSPLRQSLTLAAVSRTLERAFAVKRAPAVALVINSPGGSPVQSHLIFKRIRALAEEKNKRVFAFVEDVAASGGYMLACAADEIHADPSSVVGSIGVVSAGFGFPDLLARIGVERRVHTAGTRKTMLDPFRPEQPEDVERLLTIQREVHATFADLVRSRRGAALTAPEEELFTGEFWVGTQALPLGLIDGIGDLRSTLRARYGDKVRMPLIAPPGSWFSRRAPGGVSAALGGLDLSGGQLGAGLAQGLADVAEDRALWARYGL
ncbi:peptidase S49 [Azorhizobium oxalatiphilum]|uniref:Peptidase S49 n=1 Tax=Azorhizobium oxalatiphilum TaxID=980631 RepID=A0A917CHX0_9HYPH|nr:S49 family peptidase [Azorhizobium oxalatiphilum]GGF88971.1 peptidase S49 [Azorhizobium oxalatiphilum]